PADAGGASTTRTGHALTPRTICPAGRPATAGVTASDRAPAESPARAAAAPGTIATLEPLTTTPLFTSTTPGTRSRIPATSRAYASVTLRSSPNTRTSIGCGFVVRSP